jgi:hypothetical protein
LLQDEQSFEEQELHEEDEVAPLSSFARFRYSGLL